MGKGFKTGPGSTNILNFKVVGNPKPADLDKTVIWIDTDVKIPCWALAADNPYIAYHDVDLMANLKLGDGYISDNGSITSPTSSSLERHTEDYIPVEHGKDYVYNYTVSATNSMWLAVAEYTQSEEGYSFSKRNVLVSSVSGTSQTGTFTPSSSDVKAVRLSWRTFPDTSCSVSLVSENVPYTIDGTENGAVFIRTGYGGFVEFNALRKNDITVYPLATYQYVDGTWVERPAQISLNGEWKDWTFFLFKAGVGLADGFTGFTNAEISNELITVTIKTSSENTKYSTSNEKIDVTNYKTAFFEIQKASFSGASGYNQRAHVHVGEAKAQIGNSISGGSGTFITDGAIAVDISALSGEVDVKASAYSSDEDTVTFKILIKNIYFR